MRVRNLWHPFDIRVEIFLTSFSNKYWFSCKIKKYFLIFANNHKDIFAIVKLLNH